MNQLKKSTINNLELILYWQSTHIYTRFSVQVLHIENAEVKHVVENNFIQITSILFLTCKKVQENF